MPTFISYTYKISGEKIPYFGNCLVESPIKKMSDIWSSECSIDNDLRNGQGIPIKKNSIKIIHFVNGIDNN